MKIILFLVLFGMLLVPAVFAGGYFSAPSEDFSSLSEDFNSLSEDFSSPSEDFSSPSEDLAID